MQNTQTPLAPIINGSFNHELTNEEMLSFDFETKKQLAWNLIVSIQFAHSFRDVAAEVFTVVPSKFTHDMLLPESIDEILVTVRAEFQQRHKQLLRLTSDYYYRIGKEIAECQKKLGFGGFIKMDYRKLIGYVHATGSWNDFSHIEVADGIEELERLSPRFYKRNNCNNGLKRHHWTITGEYVTMVCDYLSVEDKEEWLKFYKDHFQKIGNRIKADSIRYELNELTKDAFSMELVMWWD